MKQKITLILFGLLLCIIFLEIGLRIGGFIILSLREGKNRCALKEKGVYRIMCLGGSTTASGGEYSYPSQLERILNEGNIGIRFKVINRGVESADSTSILSQLNENLDRYLPDMVITMMGENDGSETMVFDDSWKVRLNLIIQRIRVYKLAKLLWLHLENKIQEIKYNKSGPLNIDFVDKHSNNSAIESRIFYEKSLIYKNEKNFSEAEISIQKAIEIEPGNYDYYIQLADCYLAENKNKEAEVILREVIEKQPDNLEALCHIGWCYRNQGRYKEAEGVFKKAIAIEPGEPKPYWELISMYKFQGEQEELEDLYGMLIKKDSKNDFFVGLMATSYLEQKKYQKAKEYYRKVNELRQRYYNPVTRSNYKRLKDIVMQRGIRLVCVQHATRNVELLKRLFDSTDGVIFVDNEKVFKDALMRGRYDDYFADCFAGDFGHCTPKGNGLLAENIASVILAKVFSK